MDGKDKIIPMELKPRVYISPKRFEFNPLWFGLLAFTILTAGGLYYFRDQVGFPRKSPGEEIVMRVGEENIYQKELDLELVAFGTNGSGIDAKKYILEKLASDSATLQGANKEGFSSLGADIYNSPTKDYLNRISKIREIEKRIEGQADGIEGVMVAIWFNNMRPGPMGYEKGKPFALKKITELHRLVKEKKITIEEAGERIQEDESLAQVDPVYKNNAMLKFRAKNGERITFNKGFDDILFGLDVGEVSDIYTGKYDESSGKTIEAMYMFGQVLNKTQAGQVVSFQDWVSQQRQNYATRIY